MGLGAGWGFPCQGLAGAGGGGLPRVPGVDPSIPHGNGSGKLALPLLPLFQSGKASLFPFGGRGRIKKWQDRTNKWAGQGAS